MRGENNSEEEITGGGREGERAAAIHERQRKGRKENYSKENMT